MKKQTIALVAGFAAGVLLTATILTSSDNSAQDAADYATKHGVCKAAGR